MRTEQRRKLVVCVGIAGAHCLKIKGLRGKALTTAVWLLHILGYSVQISLRKFTTSQPEYVEITFHPKQSVFFCNMSFLFLFVTDHVNWRRGENPGWDPGSNWISKGKCLLDVSQTHLYIAFSTTTSIVYVYIRYKLSYQLKLHYNWQATTLIISSYYNIPYV